MSAVKEITICCSNTLFKELAMKIIISCAAVFLFVCSTMAEDKVEGKIVSIEKGKLTMTDKDGMVETTYKIADEVKITCDGKECKLNDLGKGCLVTVSMQTRGDSIFVVKIKAKSSS
jgi:hypothetical protein